MHKTLLLRCQVPGRSVCQVSVHCERNIRQMSRQGVACSLDTLDLGMHAHCNEWALAYLKAPPKQLNVGVVTAGAVSVGIFNQQQTAACTRCPPPGMSSGPRPHPQSCSITVLPFIQQLPSGSASFMRMMVKPRYQIPCKHKL